MARPLFILSPGYCDPLVAQVGTARPVVARRDADDVGRRFAASGAAVALIDARGDADGALGAVSGVHPIVEAQGAAILVLVAREDATALPALRAAGATHFLTTPIASDLLAEAIAYAEAGAERRVRTRSGDPAGAALGGFLARDLARALDAQEIEVRFQPQVAMVDGAIVGAEALMRWHHATLGALGADALLDAASRAGTVPALTEAVHVRALTLAAAWPKALAGLRLSLNVTAQDLASEGFVAAMLSRIDASGFARDRVTLEITEQGMIEAPDHAAALLRDLRAAGVRIAVDDFGTGYSSLAYLSQLPLDYLKLDRALTQDLTRSARDRTVVRGIIDLAHSLGLRVIAEGVETADQRDELAAAGVAMWQGFLCAEPGDIDALTALIR